MWSTADACSCAELKVSYRNDNPKIMKRHKINTEGISINKTK